MRLIIPDTGYREHVVSCNVPHTFICMKGKSNEKEYEDSTEEDILSSEEAIP